MIGVLFLIMERTLKTPLVLPGDAGGEISLRRPRYYGSWRQGLHLSRFVRMSITFEIRDEYFYECLRGSSPYCMDSPEKKHPPRHQGGHRVFTEVNTKYLNQGLDAGSDILWFGWLKQSASHVSHDNSHSVVCRCLQGEERRRCRFQNIPRYWDTVLLHR